MDNLGWIEPSDLPAGSSYRMAHSVVATAGGYVFDRSFIDYITGPAHCPLVPMAPRCEWGRALFRRACSAERGCADSNRYCLDKWLYQLRCTPQMWRSYTLPAKAGAAPVQFGFCETQAFSLIALLPF